MLALAALDCDRPERRCRERRSQASDSIRLLGWFHPITSYICSSSHAANRVTSFKAASNFSGGTCRRIGRNERPESLTLRDILLSISLLRNGSCRTSKSSSVKLTVLESMFLGCCTTFRALTISSKRIIGIVASAKSIPRKSLKYCR